VVRFDDLGVSFAVPSGMRVIGDDELAARIRSTANPRVTADLKRRAAQGRGLPLLTLANEKESTDNVGLTLIVAAVPEDTSATELMNQQLAVLKDNLTEFAVTEGPTAKMLDGVSGAEVAHAYVLQGPRGPSKSHARMRIFVRKGRAFVLTVVWPEPAHADTDLQASALLEGLHFYDPAP